MALALAGGSAGGPAAAPKIPLMGSAEAPGPGDPDGSGYVSLRVNRAKRTISWSFTGLRKIGTPTAAHIHRGKPGEAGPVFVPLGSSFKRQGGTQVIQSDMVEFLKAPANFYVNVHNAEFPNGAIRGQIIAILIG